MYTVYIVEDEALILENIANNFPWEENGFSVIGFHEFPHEALSEIIRLKPDVVFTDLKMPGLSGLELIQVLKDKQLDSEYVIISAHDDFLSSRDFFRMQGFDYILKPIQPLEIQNLLEKLFVHLMSTKGMKINEETGGAKTSFQQLIQYLNEHSEQRHSLTSLSQQFHINAHYICNLFAKEYHSTLTKYVNELRMEKIIEKMSESDQTLKVIAQQCGYGDYYHFCKSFKNHYHMTPAQYRKKLQSETHKE